MKKKLLIAFGCSLLTFTHLNAQIPTNGLIFENHFNQSFDADLPINANFSTYWTWANTLVDDKDGVATSALGLYSPSEGAPTLAYNNLENNLQLLDTLGNGLTYYCNAIFDSTQLTNWCSPCYMSILSNGKHFIRIRKDNDSLQDPNSVAIQFGFYDGNTSPSTFGWCISTIFVPATHLMNWNAFGMTYVKMASGGRVSGYFGNAYSNVTTTPSGGASTEISYAVEDSIFFIGGNETNWFQGSIDNVLLYNRALSPSELRGINTTYGIASVEENNLLHVSVFPNPASNVLTIKSDEVTNYSITSLTGSYIKSGNTLNTSTISIEELAPGTYFLTMNQNGQVQTVQFVKQ
jgi:Secretion system C-terminal sorting domain